MARFDLVCAGLSTVDVLALCDRPLKEDEKVPAAGVLVDGGGPAGTAACAAARCGLRAAVLSFIGRDFWAPFVREGFRSFGVSLDLLREVEGAATPVSLIAVNTVRATRTIFWDARAALAARGPAARLAKQAIDTRCLHYDGHLMALSTRLAAAARQRGVLTSYDCGSAKPGWERLAALSDIFIASAKFARDIGSTPARAAAAVRRRFGCLAAVTDGPAGAVYADEVTGKLGRSPAPRTRALDTTGCGDVFHGAFLAAYLGGAGFPASLRFAAEAASAKARAPGGRAGIPSRDWLRARLARSY